LAKEGMFKSGSSRVPLIAAGLSVSGF